jgi:hypothetical protein
MPAADASSPLCPSMPLSGRTEQDGYHVRAAARAPPAACQEGLCAGNARRRGEERRHRKRGDCLIDEISTVFFLTDDTAVVSDSRRSATRLTDPFPGCAVPRLPNTDVCARG